MKKNSLAKLIMATMSLVVAIFLLASSASAQSSKKYWINGKWAKLPAGYVVVKSFDLVSEQITTVDDDKYSAEDISKATQKKYSDWKKAGNTVFASVDSDGETVTEFTKSLSDYTDEERNAQMDKLTRPRPVVKTVTRPVAKPAPASATNENGQGVALNVNPGQGRDNQQQTGNQQKFDALVAQVDGIRSDLSKVINNQEIDHKAILDVKSTQAEQGKKLTDLEMKQHEFSEYLAAQAQQNQKGKKGKNK